MRDHGATFSASARFLCFSPPYSSCGRLPPATLAQPLHPVVELRQGGLCPGIGRTASGHNLHWAWVNTRFSLSAGLHDLFGWPYLSWIFLPLGIYALRRKAAGLLLAAAMPSLVLVYVAYWIGSWLLGPRYYYESLPGLAIASAVGVAWLGGWLRPSRGRLAAAPPSGRVFSWCSSC
jgi:hypothetical protein